MARCAPRWKARSLGPRRASRRRPGRPTSWRASSDVPAQLPQRGRCASFVARSRPPSSSPTSCSGPCGRLAAGYDVDEVELLGSAATPRNCSRGGRGRRHDVRGGRPAAVLPVDRAGAARRPRVGDRSARVRGLRPSVVMAALRARAERGPRFKPAPFLASLLAGYDLVVARQGKAPGAVVRLVDVVRGADPAARAGPRVHQAGVRPRPVPAGPERRHRRGGRPGGSCGARPAPAPGCRGAEHGRQERSAAALLGQSRFEQVAP